MAKMGHGDRGGNRQPVIIVNTLALGSMNPAVTNTTYLDALDEFDDAGYNDKGTEEGNCPCPLRGIWDVIVRTPDWSHCIQPPYSPRTPCGDTRLNKPESADMVSESVNKHWEQQVGLAFNVARFGNHRIPGVLR